MNETETSLLRLVVSVGNGNEVLIEIEIVLLNEFDGILHL